MLDVAALRAGSTVAGNVGHVVFVAQPLRADAGPAPAPSTTACPPATRAVLVVTRHVARRRQRRRLLHPGGRGGARRRGRGGRRRWPGASARRIVRAVGATRQIAGGDLAATVPVDGRDYPELAELAEAINTMGDNLSRAQGLEREFLLSVSHELRTPLTSIRGYADAIADGATDDVPGAVRIIGSEARRLERLVAGPPRPGPAPGAASSRSHTQPVDCGARGQARGRGLRARGGRRPGSTLVADDAGAAAVGRRRSRPRGPGRRQPRRERPQVRHRHGRGRRAARWGDGWRCGSPTTGPGISAEDLPHIFERHYSSDRSRAASSAPGWASPSWPSWPRPWAAWSTPSHRSTDGRGARMVLWLSAAPAPRAGGRRGPETPTVTSSVLPTPALPLHPPV